MGLREELRAAHHKLQPSAGLWGMTREEAAKTEAVTGT